MTQDELIKQIEDTANHCRSIGMRVEINSSMPWVDVDVNPNDPDDGKYFFQGEEASNLLDECAEYVNEEDYILWYAQGW